ncbi:hypothetical protein ACROYT_G037586 [Oculina patagonica]
MNPGSRKIFRAKPPDKGSFPLDHDGECKEYMKKYMKCLRENNNGNHMCRTESKNYLQCRMDRGEAKKLKNPRRVNKQVSEEIYEVYHVSVPIGSALCNTCRKGHSKSDEETKGKEENARNEGSTVKKDGLRTVADNEGDDEDVSFWIDEEQRQHERRAVLNEAVGNISDGRVSPIASTLNSNWESISSTQKPTICGKSSSSSAVLTTIAPDQEEKVFDH